MGLAADGWRASTTGGAGLRAGAVAPLVFFGGCGSALMMFTAGIEDEEGKYRLLGCFAAAAGAVSVGFAAVGALSRAVQVA